MANLVEELERELADVKPLLEEQLRLTPRLFEPGSCVVATGAGDSYAAALSATIEGAAAVEPMSLAATPAAKALASRGCVLLALSVGGRSVAVVEAARRFREVGGRVIAVTANPNSRLAAVADEAVKLVYGGLAAGVGAARHLVMLAALAALWGRRPVIEAWSGECKWFMDAEAHVGCLEAASSALYGVLKLYEVYGSMVRFYPLEDFLHAPVYSVHSVTVYEGSGCIGRAREAVHVLHSVGLRTYTVRALAAPWGNVLRQSYAVLSCLYEAVKRDGVVEPAYRRHRGLEALTRLIYG